jgi:hypothetical protein
VKEIKQTTLARAWKKLLDNEETTTVLSLMYTLLHYTPIRIICYKQDFH